METISTRPNPYRVDAPLKKVQSIEYDGDNPYLIRHDFTRLDASNFALLKQHENDVVRVTEQIAKGQFRSKNRSEPADANLYKALITGGGWRSALWEPCRDEESIPAAARSIYTFDEEANVWKPGWFELTREEMVGFTQERQSHAIDNMTRCAGEYIATSSSDLGFMFEKSGLMRVLLLVGERDSPAYKLLFDFRRPDDKRRTKFREGFAFGIEHKPQPGKKNDYGRTETKIEIEAAVSFFDEYFAAPVDDPEHSLIVFEKPAASAELEASPAHQVFDVRPYQEDDRATFLSLFDPNYKMEAAAAVVGAFSKTDRELPKR